MKHTPGPWAVHSGWRTIVVPASDVSKSIGGSIDAEDEAQRHAKIIASEAGTMYAQYHRSRVLRGDEANANAQLIAAAPELLDALRTMLIHFDEADCINPTEDGVIQQARAAIAKATA